MDIRKQEAKKRKTEAESLRLQLDLLVGKIVKLRDSDEYGYLNCPICRKQIHIKQSEAMHYKGRSSQNTRYDLLNVHAGCEFCNHTMTERKYQIFSEYIDNKHESGTTSILESLSKQECKRTLNDLRELKAKYTILYNKLKKQKMFSI